jgi:cell wall-associated NlpC family hydrolase
MTGRRVRLVAAAPLVALASGVAVVALFLGSVTGAPTTTTGSASCTTTVRGDGLPKTLDADQLANAGVIVRSGSGRGVPPRGLVVALATAMQESGLRNLTYGDRDSVGLFQQRPSQGWGTVAELTDPPTAAGKFYDALLRVPGWIGMPVTRAAQAVQRSAFPNAYAKWEPLATALVGTAGTAGTTGTAGCADVVGASLPSGAVGAMLRVALAQQGKPYVWGATGPSAFDCSGLIVYAWRMAGFRVTVRTAAQMHDVSTPVPWGSEQPGDLLFGSFGTRVAGAGHVAIVVRPGLAVEAPSAGKTVRLRAYAPTSDRRLGRLRPSALVPLARAGMGA